MDGERRVEEERICGNMNKSGKEKFLRLEGIRVMLGKKSDKKVPT